MVECPNCGTVNPDASGLCVACGLPLGSEYADAGSSGLPDSPAQDTGEDLQPPQAGPEEPAPAAFAQDDWLAQLLAATADETGLPPPPTAPSQRPARPELPLWLRDLVPEEPSVRAVSSPVDRDVGDELLAELAEPSAVAMAKEEPADLRPEELGDREVARLIEEIAPGSEALADVEADEFGDPGLTLLIDELAAGDEDDISLGSYGPVSGEDDLLLGPLDWEAALAAGAVEGEGAGLGVPWDLTPDEMTRTDIEVSPRATTEARRSMIQTAIGAGLAGRKKVRGAGVSEAPQEVNEFRARVLEELATRPAKPRRLRAGPAPGVPSDRIVRIAVPAVLITVLVLASIGVSSGRGGPSLVRLPAGYPAGPARMHDMLRHLGQGDQVLAAFEYGPAEADELDIVAATILRQLIGQGAHLSVVSTRTDGLVAARGLVDEVVETMVAAGQVAGDNAPVRLNFVGYQPGNVLGVAGILHRGPRPDLVVVFAARAGPLRWWIEQVHTLADPPPIAAGTSAALEATASPYLGGDSPQLAGAVSGVSGAAYYDRIANNETDGIAARRLDALAAGNVAIVALAIGGAAVSGFRGQRARQGSNR